MTFANKEKPNTKVVDVSTLTGNAIDVLEAANKLTDKCYNSKTFAKAYGPVVYEACQVPNDKKTGKHWMVYLNGNAIDVSVACYYLKDEDFLRLNYETSKHHLNWFDFAKFSVSLIVQMSIVSKKRGVNQS